MGDVSRMEQLDGRHWVRPESVVAVRMGSGNETLVYIDGNPTPFDVDLSINEVLRLIDRGVV